MYNINCASARHIEAFADIPLELADKILAYRKKRKRIFHIDELYRIGGISRKYFRRLVSVFYVPNQVVPRIGTQPPYSNTLSSVTLQQKHQNRNANLTKRKMKIKKHENQRKIENRGRKRKLQENRKGKNRRVKRQKTTDAEHRSDFPESPPSARRLNINERVARLLKTAPKYEDDNVGMEEGNIIQNRKRKYRSVKHKRKTTDTENAIEYSESAPSIQRANINERIARLLKTTPKYEDDNVGMEDDNTDIRKNRKRKYQCAKRPEIEGTEQSMPDSPESTSSVVVE